MSDWRLRELTGEALRNLLSAWPRTMVTAVLVGGLVAALTWSELTTSTSILRFHRDWVAAGAHVVVASHDEGLPVGRCTALASRSDVASSGALAQGEPVQTDLAPGTQFQTGLITPGIVSIWDPSIRSPATALRDAVGVGADAAEELGLASGMYLAARPGGTVSVMAVDTDRRSPQRGRWLLLPMAPAQSAEECWVEFVPGAAPFGRELLEHVFADAGSELLVRQWLSQDEFARDPVAELEGRPQAGAWAVAGGALAVLVWLTLWFRRSEMSLYRVLGSTRTALWCLVQTEVLVIVTLSGIGGYLFAWGLHSGVSGFELTLEQLTLAARTAISTVTVPAMLGPVAALAIGDRKRLLAQLKEG